MVQIRPLTEDMRPAFERLLRDAWEQNWDDEIGRAIIRWRYYDRPSGVTWVADDGSKCVGMLDAMLRPHMLDGQRVMVCETGDWFCLPAYRTGLGLGLLRRSMSHGPLLVIGGSHVTLELLPKFRFQAAAPARYYIRPITLRGLAGNLLRQGAWRHERLAQIVPNISWRTGRDCWFRGTVRLMGEADTIPPAGGTGLVQILEPWHWQWLLKIPREFATPVGLAFCIENEVVGCSISQLEQTAADLDGRIIHLQFTESKIGQWVVNSTVNFLRECGVGFIRCCASTPIKFQLLEDAGFLHSKSVPIHWYSRDLPLPSSIDAGFLRGDDAMPFQALRGRRLGEQHG